MKWLRAMIESALFALAIAILRRRVRKAQADPWMQMVRRCDVQGEPMTDEEFKALERIADVRSI